MLELVLGQRADELPGLAPDCLVREGEADAEGERINVGHGGLRDVADVPPDRSDTAHRRPTVKGAQRVRRLIESYLHSGVSLWPFAASAKSFKTVCILAE